MSQYSNLIIMSVIGREFFSDALLGNNMNADTCQCKIFLFNISQVRMRESCAYSYVSSPVFSYLNLNCPVTLPLFPILPIILRLKLLYLGAVFLSNICG